MDTAGDVGMANLRVMMIEDDPLFAELVATRLRRSSLGPIDLETHHSLAAGLDAIRRDPPDAVLLDLHLPDAYGLKSLESVTEEFPELPVIVLTGSQTEGKAIDAIRMGAEDFLVKGKINGNAIARAVLYTVERHRARTSGERTA